MILPRSSERSAGSFSGTATNVVAFGRGDLGTRVRFVALVIPSFSSKRGHVTEKHVLNGRKRDKLGNQTFEVLQRLKRTVYMIPFTYFT